MSLYLEFSKFIASIRNYFYKTEAIEVFTDILQDYPNLDNNIYPVDLYVFNEKGEKIKKFLHTSPEYEMKKLLSKEKKDIFQITKVFRNFEGSYKHKIEFLMLEWYRTDYNLYDLMNDTHMLLIHTVTTLHKTPFFEFRNKKYDIREYQLITVEEAFKRFTGVDISSIDSMNSFLKQNEENFKEKDNWEELFFHIYAFYVEPYLGTDRLTFIYDFPPELSALARVENEKGKRFEAYIGGIELVNGYFEETDPEKIMHRLKSDVEKKKKETKTTYPIDTKFINTIKELPVCSGASLGIERLFMIIKNLPDIYFLKPTLK